MLVFKFIETKIVSGEEVVAVIISKLWKSRNADFKKTAVIKPYKKGVDDFFSSFEIASSEELESSPEFIDKWNIVHYPAQQILCQLNSLWCYYC